MPSNFVAKYIPEPDLIFGNGNEDKDPRIGLAHFGPYFYSDEDSALESVRLGIVGNAECISLTKKVLELLKCTAKSQKPNYWLFPDYPGMNQDSNFKCVLKTSENWNASMSNDFELARIEKIANANERIGRAVVLYMEKIEKIAESDDRPDVIVCTLPNLIESHCGIGPRTYGAKTTKPSALDIKIANLQSEGQTFLSEWGVKIEDDYEPKEKGFDFRNALKGKAMKHGIPIQLIKESTLNHMVNDTNSSSENLATILWNFSTALYYKASGKPWRLAKLRQDTCYVGISFFVNKLSPNPNMQISMAQVFTHNGEGLVLRGTEVDIDKKTKKPYLKNDQARTLMKRALEKYYSSSGRNPARVVIHKSSEFSKEEQDGFNDAIYRAGITKKDFVAIRTSRRWVNFTRLGNYPVLRGTLIELANNEFLLYSSGFSPRLRSYPGHRIPNALRIYRIGDSQNEEIAEEILGLTKLDWNTTAFSTSMPITIKFATEVGRVLSELQEDEVLKDHYKFFM